MIRIESLASGAAEAGRSLRDLAPGAPLPAWVQAQTTYAKLRQSGGGGSGGGGGGDSGGSSGEWRVQVLKQKIWCNGTSYELQEIYGAAGSGGAAAAGGGGAAVGSGGAGGGEGGGGGDDGLDCVICLSAPRDTTALPCRHMCMCRDCAVALKARSNKCPVCRCVPAGCDCFRCLPLLCSRRPVWTG